MHLLPLIVSGLSFMNSEIALNHNTTSRHVNDSLEVQQGYVFSRLGVRRKRSNDRPSKETKFFDGA